MNISTKDIKDTASSLSGSVNGIFWSMLIILGLLTAYAMFLMNAGREELKGMIVANQEVIQDNNTVIREMIQLIGRIDGKLDTLSKK